MIIINLIIGVVSGLLAGAAFSTFKTTKSLKTLAIGLLLTMTSLYFNTAAVGGY